MSLFRPLTRPASYVCACPCFYHRRCEAVWCNGDLIRKHRDAAHTLERAIEREDLAIRDSEPLPHRPLADIRDPRRAASPRQMQRSRIPLSSPMSECIY